MNRTCLFINDDLFVWSGLASLTVLALIRQELSRQGRPFLKLNPVQVPIQLYDHKKKNDAFLKGN